LFGRRGPLFSGFVAAFGASLSQRFELSLARTVLIRAISLRVLRKLRRIFQLFRDRLRAQVEQVLLRSAQLSAPARRTGVREFPSLRTS
jgi:hypothetical protein